MSTFPLTTTMFILLKSLPHEIHYVTRSSTLPKLPNRFCIKLQPQKNQQVLYPRKLHTLTKCAGNEQTKNSSESCNNNNNNKKNINQKFYSSASSSMPSTTTNGVFQEKKQDEDKETGKISKLNPRERSFKTSYGHIAALEWGNPNGPNKLLCVHGWLDNAGSYEPLVPKILKHGDNLDRYHVIAIDQPGCGFSSHKPPGAQYSFFTTIIEMSRVVRDLGWQRYSLVGHSLAAQYCLLHACIYPDQVQSVTALDIPHALVVYLDNWPSVTRKSIEEIIKLEDQECDQLTTTINKSYTYDEILERQISSYKGSLDKEAAKILLKRSVTKASDGENEGHRYFLNGDVRQKIVGVELRPDYSLMARYMTKHFRTNLLIVRATQTTHPVKQKVVDHFGEIFRKNCKLFIKSFVEGTHHLHMNNPDRVAPIICKFLDQVHDKE